jgi:hypothetical protein
VSRHAPGPRLAASPAPTNWPLDIALTVDLLTASVILLHLLFVPLGRHVHTRFDCSFFRRTQLREMAKPQDHSARFSPRERVRNVDMSHSGMQPL